jgi:predicted nucleic acid-binding protein
MRTWLMDTGPFIAYISRTDPRHRSVAGRVDGFAGQLVTTGAVITEVMYFLSGVPAGPVSFAELLLASGTRIAESTQPRHVVAAAELMAKYADTPMDFADATLVLLAEELGVMDILTLDRRGFSTYRTAKGKAFRLVL